MEKRRFNLQTVIPIATAALAVLFIVLGVTEFGFWSNQPMPGFFPTIIAVVLLLSSIACFVQLARDKDAKQVKYNRNELMVILGAAGIIIGTMVVGLVASCLIYLFVWLKFVERAPWKVVLIVELIVAAIILGVFVGWLQVRFPMGLFAGIL